MDANHYFEGKLKNVDGLELFYRSWLPAAEPRAHLLIAHGLGEHSGRYGHMAQFFNEKGVAVFAIDHVGHGRSGGKKGHVRAFGDFSRDLEQFRQFVIAQHGDKPLTLFGHSLGGIIAFDYALQHQQHLSALVLSAPALALKLKVPAWQKKAVRALVGVLPALTLNNGLDAAWLSHDLPVVNAYRTDPLVHPKISLTLFLGMVDVGRRCAERAAELKLPTMMIFGADDPIISYEFAHQSFEKLGSEHKQELVYPNTLHEIHNDFVKQDEFASVWQWLEKIL